MKIQEDDDLLLEASYKSAPTIFQIYAFKVLKVLSCLIGIIVISIILSKSNINVFINFKEKQSSNLAPLSTESNQFQPSKPILREGTKIGLSDVSVVGNPLTRCLVKSNDVLEVVTHSSEGGCAIPFERLKLPTKKSLSNQVLEFDMEFVSKPSDVVGRHGGIYYGDHVFNRLATGNTVVDWIDRTADHGYRFYQTKRDPDCYMLLPREKEPVKHMKIIIKSNGEQILVAENDVWKNLTGSTAHLLDQPYLGFWAWGNNHLRISNFLIRAYTKCDLDE